MPVLQFTTGDATYGWGAVAYNGAVPAALAAVTGNQSCWISTTEIAYQDYTAAPVIRKYNIGSAAITLLDAFGANLLRAGNGVWAAWLGGSGVRTSVAGLGPFPTAGLIEVSETGQVAIIVDRATGTGIRVYSATGTLLRTINTALTSTVSIHFRQGLLTYLDASGWHLYDVSTGRPAAFVSRMNILRCIPATVGGETWVFELEQGAVEALSIRNVSSGLGYVIPTTFQEFGPDMKPLTNGKLRLAWSTTAGEGAADLVLTDVDLTDGTTRRGTISGGAIVWADGPTLEEARFPSANAASLYIPYPHPVADVRRNSLMSDAWMGWVQEVSRLLQTHGTAINNLQEPSAPSFGQVIAVDGGTIQADGPNDQILVDGAGAVTVTADQGTSTLTITATAGAPVDAEYIVAAAHATLTAERVATDTATVAWDFTTAAQAKANVPDNAITNAKLRDSIALSVIGRSANTVGDPADISVDPVSAADAVLRESGAVLGFGQVATAGLANDAVTYAKIQNVSAASRVLGRGSAGGAGNVEELTLGSGLALSGTELTASGSGGGHVHGLMRFLGDGATTTFNLADLAEYLEHVGVNGSFRDPSLFSLSADRSQIVFATAPGAGEVVTPEYVIATV